ncbi:Hypothetical predicted protein [Lecanosticta acicola]|uniref:Altered inheritance of mitochondria protein 21 n=1 Tax=Lecanosticta acicola TaxID=111012 RepID=A0AAI8YVF4_9PEZI|nr:Hypothetical predicted protein [Lecanosticta acicola]
MSIPIVPPRPQRNQPAHTSGKNDTPLLPPRPSRNLDPSPDREASTRSPLNAPPTASSNRQIRPRSSQDLPQRPPSVSLPDIGQEGAEYSSFDQLPPEARAVSTSPGEQTRNVSADLPIHQPKASVPQSTATRQIQNVTGTDSTQAAAAGIGRARPADDVHKLPPADVAGGTGSPLSSLTTNPRRAPSTDLPNALGQKASFNRSTPSLQPLERTTSRTGSMHGADDYEHGIPEIGRQVPLLAMAGDVQAPSPGQGLSQHAPGIGFFNDGSGKSHRKRGSRQDFGDSDAYGLQHSTQDQFEKEWVRKHPREAAKEGYYSHLPKPETALTSEQLNRLVHQSEPVVAAATPGTPDEHDADEFLSRMSSAQSSPAPAADRKKRSSSGAEAASPFKKSFGLSERNRLHPDDAIDSEDDFTGQRRASRFMDDDHEHEHTDGTPILAADELMKRPSSAFMHAAVTPDPDAYHDDFHYESDTGSRKGSIQPNSRPSSRPSSVHGSQSYHGGSLHRFVSREEEHHSAMGTPLEEIEEYEPLFPEEGEKESAKRTFKKRPELAQHHFPSRDVWEDTPSSLQYSATVSTPDLEKRQAATLEADSKSVAETFETPEQEMQRRSQNSRENDMTSDSKTFLKPHFKPGVAEEIHRPGVHRFPSSDVWEDSPDSYTLVNQTTVSNLDVEGPKSPEEPLAKPSIPTRPQRKSKLAEGGGLPEDAQRDVKSPPNAPEKPKVPVRPARSSKPEQLEGAGLERSGDAAAAVKAKPPVPARPGGKFGAQAGFLADLNNRLRVGPQGPPPKRDPEPEADEEALKAPLADARKTRAKGPQRRKPAAAPSHHRKSSVTFAFSPLINCWSIDEGEELTVHEREEKEAQKQEIPSSGIAAPEAEKALAMNELENVESVTPAEEAGDAHDIARRISTSEQPGTEARQHGESETELKAALAKAGAAPTSYSAPEDAIAEGGEEEEGKIAAAKEAEA